MEGGDLMNRLIRQEWSDAKLVGELELLKSTINNSLVGLSKLYIYKSC